VDAPTSESAYEEGVRKKFTAMVHAAAFSKADALIIPDVGCGVFGNDPTIVGRIAGQVLRGYSGYFRHVLFTGKQAFFEAAASGLTGFTCTCPPSLPHAGNFRPHNACIVCGEPLNADLAVLLGPTGQRAEGLQFLHADCSELLAGKFPDHTAMHLPTAAANAESFLRALDVNCNGILEKEEVRCAMAALWVGDLGSFNAEFESRWQTWDANRSGDLGVGDLAGNSSPILTAKRAHSKTFHVDLDQLPMSLLEWVRLHAGKDVK